LILALPAHAKLNLSLEVHGLREDGHHEVSTVLQAISLHDLLMVERASDTELHGGHPDDLVLRAQRALEVAAGLKVPARFRLFKRIPVGAGLGGGSSDAAAALHGLAALYGLDLDLQPLAAELGADVRFFLNGGSALAGGKGDQIHTLPAARDWYAIAWPGFEVSTAAVYRRWDEVGGDGENELTRAAFAEEPRLQAFASRLPGWRMTGSGSAFFMPCPDRKAAEAAIAGLDCWRTVARPVPAWEHSGR
jgi:4-diphosphocytidyl-2-C-methyl-D-erythritol kinase